MNFSQVPALPALVQAPPSKPHQTTPTTTSTTTSSSPSQSARQLPVDPPSRGSPLQGRVTALEQANRSLLEELVRLHSELKTEGRRHDDAASSSRAEMEVLHQELVALRREVKAVSEGHRDQLASQEHQLATSLAYIKDAEARLSGKQSGLHSQLARLERGGERRAGEVREELVRLQSTAGDAHTRLSSLERDAGARLLALERAGSTLQDGLGEAEQDRALLGSALEERRQGAEQLAEQVGEDRRRARDGFTEVQDQLGRAWGAIHDLQKQASDADRNTSSSLSSLEGVVVGGFAERDRQGEGLARLLEEVRGEGLRSGQRLEASLQSSTGLMQAELAGLEARVGQEGTLARDRARQSMLEEVGRTRAAVEEKMAALSSTLGSLDKESQEKLTALEGAIKHCRAQGHKVFSALSESLRLVQSEGETSRRHLAAVIHAEVTVRLRELDALRSALSDLKASVGRDVQQLCSSQRGAGESLDSLREQLSRTSSQLHAALHQASARALAEVGRRLQNVDVVTDRLEQQVAACGTKVGFATEELGRMKNDIQQQLATEHATRKSDLDHLTGSLRRYLTIDEYHGNRSHEVEEVRQLGLQMTEVGGELGEVKRSLRQMQRDSCEQSSSDQLQLKGLLSGLQSYLRGQEGQGGAGQEEQMGKPREEGQTDMPREEGQTDMPREEGRTDMPREEGQMDMPREEGQEGSSTPPDRLEGRGDPEEENGCHDNHVEITHSADENVLLQPGSPGISPSDAVASPDIVMEPERPDFVATPPSALAEPLVPRLSSTMFVKPSSSEDSCEDNSLNQWGIYQAWRLLKIKEAWMRPLKRKLK